MYCTNILTYFENPNNSLTNISSQGSTADLIKKKRLLLSDCMLDLTRLEQLKSPLDTKAAKHTRYRRE